MHDVIGISRTYEYQGDPNQYLQRRLAGGLFVAGPTPCRRACPNCTCAFCVACACDKCKIERLEQRVAELEGAK